MYVTFFLPFLFPLTVQGHHGSGSKTLSRSALLTSSTNAGQEMGGQRVLSAGGVSRDTLVNDSLYTQKRNDDDVLIQLPPDLREHNQAPGLATSMKKFTNLQHL